MSVVKVVRVEHEFRGDKTFDELNLWILPVTIYNRQKRFGFNFLLDTGAQQTVVTLDVQKIVGILENSQNIRGSGVGGVSSYKKGTIDSLEIASIRFNRLDILIGQLPGLFAKYGIDGLLGSDVLNNIYLELNYPTGKLTLEKTIVIPE